MKKHPLFLAALFALTLGSCDESPSNAVDTGVYTVSGPLRFNRDTRIPDDARVLVVWNVSSGSPDHLYVYGEGRVNAGDNTFRVSFKGDPPAAALNSYGLGVGLVIVTTNRTITERTYVGREADSALSHGALGGAPDYAVIYIKGSPDSVAQAVDWAGRFTTGYNAGRGIRKDRGFDEFEKVEPTIIEMIIDEFSELDWINWT